MDDLKHFMSVVDNNFVYTDKFKDIYDNSI